MPICALLTLVSSHPGCVFRPLFPHAQEHELDYLITLVMEELPSLSCWNVLSDLYSHLNVKELDTTDGPYLNRLIQQQRHIARCCVSDFFLVLFYISPSQSKCSEADQDVLKIHSYKFHSTMHLYDQIVMFGLARFISETAGEVQHRCVRLYSMSESVTHPA